MRAMDMSYAVLWPRSEFLFPLHTNPCYSSRETFGTSLMPTVNCAALAAMKQSEFFFAEASGRSIALTGADQEIENTNGSLLD